ncbi:MAG: ATP-binding cassette domain-containing protein [Pseudomonadota bacterium]
MLQLENICIALGDFTLTANWSLPARARATVIGPSGAGKSTLLNALAGFTPHQGRITLNGQDVTTATPADRGIAMLFQDGNLFPHLTLLQNVGLGMRARLRLSPQEADRARQALARTGLAGLEDRKPGDISGGQQGRAALSRILVQNKPLLLLDEPFAALGPALRDEMLDLTADLAGETGATLLMVTHAPGDVARIGGHVVFVDDGLAHPPQDAEALMADPPEALRAYLGV